MTPLATGLTAFAGALLTYVFTLCPTVYVEGSGELIGAVRGLGTAHPTGYPLFCLSGRLLAALMPFADPAYEINLVTALFSAATCGALAHLLQLRGVSCWAALAAGLSLAFSRTFWSQAVIAEVYGQALLLVVLVLGQALAASERRTRRDVLLLGWLMGLGLTTHLLQVLIWPGIAVLFLWRWSSLWRSPRLLGQGVGAVAGGYSLIAYLLARNGRGSSFHWDPIEGWGAIWHHISGGQYRSSFFSLPLEGMLLNARHWAELVVDDFHFVLLPVMLWGLWVVWRYDRSVLLLAGSAIGCNLLAALNYHRDPNGLPVFFLLSLLGLVLLLGYGLNDAMQRLGRLGRLGQSSLPVTLCATCVGLVLTSHYVESDRSQNRVAERYGLDILADLPQGAVLITEGDDVAFVLDYLQRVAGQRPDIELYNRVGRGTDLLQWREHVLSAREQNQLRLQRERALVQQGRQVHYLVPRQAPLADWDFAPAGLVYHLRPKGELSAVMGTKIEMDNGLADGFARDSWVRKIQSNYWFMAGEQRLWAGDINGAITSFEQAAAVAYDSRSTRFNVALKLYRNNELDRAATHAKAAIAIDPWQAEPYQLLAYISRKQQRLVEAEKLLKKAESLRRAP